MYPLSTLYAALTSVVSCIYSSTKLHQIAGYCISALLPSKNVVAPLRLNTTENTRRTPLHPHGPRGQPIRFLCSALNLYILLCRQWSELYYVRTGLASAAPSLPLQATWLSRTLQPQARLLSQLPLGNSWVCFVRPRACPYSHSSGRWCCGRGGGCVIPLELDMKFYYINVAFSC